VGTVLRRWSKKELCESGLVAGQRRLWEEQMGTVVMAAIRIPHFLLRHPWRPLPWAFLPVVAAAICCITLATRWLPVT
jgi:hypothetical protein